MTKQDQVFFTRLCDMMRDARLSTRYYEDRLWWANAVNFGFEIVIAIGATGSGIAGWASDPRWRRTGPLGRRCAASLRQAKSWEGGWM